MTAPIALAVSAVAAGGAQPGPWGRPAGRPPAPGLCNSPRVLYLEDFTVGRVFALGSTVVDAGEVVEFGRRFDPQPFHTDPERARESPFGGLIASGWHTASMFMRLYVDRVLGRAASLGGSGVDEIRMPHPVRPGDELTADVEVLASRPSERKPDRGTVTILGTVRNQDGVVVMTLKITGRMGRRPAG